MSYNHIYLFVSVLLPETILSGLWDWVREKKKKKSSLCLLSLGADLTLQARSLCSPIEQNNLRDHNQRIPLWSHWKKTNALPLDHANWAHKLTKSADMLFTNFCFSVRRNCLGKWDLCSCTFTNLSTTGQASQWS